MTQKGMTWEEVIERYPEDWVTIRCLAKAIAKGRLEELLKESEKEEQERPSNKVLRELMES